MSETNQKFILQEYYGNTSSGNRYFISKNGSTSKQTDQKTNGSIKEVIKNIFLPEGYPYTVSDDYMSYQVWDTAQAFCSSISGALATSALLESMGVGDEKASIYGATLTWLIKDGTGMIGRIFFAWFQGGSLDCNSKMWRLYADILNDFSFCVDLISPHVFSSLRIYVLSFSGLLRSIVGVAGSATRSSLTQHQAICNNMADVCAKDSSQETLVNLMALCFNILILSYVKSSKMLVWLLFFTFTCLHLASNYFAVKAIVMKTFNQNRFHILVQEFLNTGKILTPSDVNKREPVLSEIKRSFRLYLGASLNHVSLIHDMKRFCDQKSYLFIKKNKVYVIFHRNSQLEDHLKALFQVECIENALNHEKNMIAMYFKEANNDKIQIELEKCINMHFGELIDKINASEWSLAYAQLLIGQYKYENLKFE